MVIPRGWWDLADADDYYPCDLPEDWRLSYFANDFRATLLPAAFWITTNPLTASQWDDDLSSGFRFVAEQVPAQPREDSAQQLAPAALVQLLGSKLDGWIESMEGIESMERPASGVATGPDGHRCLRYHPLRSDEEITTGHHGYGLVAPAELHHDLRRAKDWLNRATELRERAPSLVILERPTSTTLTAWQELLDLLGFG